MSPAGLSSGRFAILAPLADDPACPRTTVFPARVEPASEPADMSSQVRASLTKKGPHSLGGREGLDLCARQD